MMVIQNQFEIGQEVYIITDKDQYKRIITAIIIKPTGLLYEASYSTSVSNHYDFELSATADIMITTTN